MTVRRQGRERVVVVGAGLAGLRATERLRELGFAGSITMVGDERRPPYNRTPLSKQLVEGRLQHDGSFKATTLLAKCGSRFENAPTQQRSA